MKKLLKNIAGGLGGMVIGFGIVWLIIALIDNGETNVKEDKDIDWMLMAASMALSMFFLVICGILQTILHEAGHLLGGFATGYKMLSFRIFKYVLVNNGECLRWKRYNISGTMGQCIMVPSEKIKNDNIPYFWYNVGGVAVNVLLAVVSLIVLRFTDLGIISMSFFLMLTFTGLFLALMNGLPLTVNGLSNDGRNIIILARKPEMRLHFLNMMRIAGEMSGGHRLKDMPGEWFTDEPVKNVKDYFILSSRVTYMSLLEDKGNLDKAREIAEELMTFGKKLPQIFALEVGTENVMLELMTTNRRDIVEKLWNKQLQRYTSANSKYSPMKFAVLYAVELIHNNNKEKAETYRQKLEKNMDNFTMPGEAKTALKLITRIA